MASERGPGARRDAPRDNVAHETSPVALLLLDVINDLEWEGGDQLLEPFEAMAPRLALLVERARAQRIPVIYVNDNYGRWRSDFQQLVRHCLEDGVRGERLARMLQPRADDYFVLKPKHSGFFATALEQLLDYLGAGTLILTGVAGNICVLFTAHDAHMRDFHVVAPGDCIASNTVEANDFAIRQLADVLGADVSASSELDLEQIIERARA